MNDKLSALKDFASKKLYVKIYHHEHPEGRDSYGVLKVIKYKVHPNKFFNVVPGAWCDWYLRWSDGVQGMVSMNNYGCVSVLGKLDGGSRSDELDEVIERLYQAGFLDHV